MIILWDAITEIDLISRIKITQQLDYHYKNKNVNRNFFQSIGSIEVLPKLSSFQEVLLNIVNKLDRF
jgi:hypothetical protein